MITIETIIKEIQGTLQPYKMQMPSFELKPRPEHIPLYEKPVKEVGLLIFDKGELEFKEQLHGRELREFFLEKYLFMDEPSDDESRSMGLNFRAIKWENVESATKKSLEPHIEGIKNIWATPIGDKIYNNEIFDVKPSGIMYFTPRDPGAYYTALRDLFKLISTEGYNIGALAYVVEDGQVLTETRITSVGRLSNRFNWVRLQEKIPYLETSAKIPFLNEKDVDQIEHPEDLYEEISSDLGAALDEITSGKVNVPMKPTSQLMRMIYSMSENGKRYIEIADEKYKKIANAVYHLHLLNRLSEFSKDSRYPTGDLCGTSIEKIAIALCTVDFSDEVVVSKLKSNLGWPRYGTHMAMKGELN